MKNHYNEIGKKREQDRLPCNTQAISAMPRGGDLVVHERSQKKDKNPSHEEVERDGMIRVKRKTGDGDVQGVRHPISACETIQPR
jgi:hypothetical protein